MSASDKSSKTEKPTPRRVREAREKGQIAKTPEIAVWGSLLVAIFLIESAIRRGGRVFEEMLHDMARNAGRPRTSSAIDFLGDALVDAFVVIAPILVGLLIFVVVANLAQVGLKPSMKRLKPDFKRLNVFKGVKGMFSTRALWELGKALIKTAILAAIAWPIMANAMDLLLSSNGSLSQIVAITGKSTFLVARNIAAAGLVIAAVDYIVQKRRVTKELMMTKQEVREEYRNTEGDPRVKQAIRSRQAAMSRNRMIKMVSSADVVLVNPTHYAVALRYDAAVGAPEVVAKGAGSIAARIRQEAEEHGITVVREPLLCRTIFRSCELGETIPIALYEAVAQVLAFVFALRARGRDGGYHEIDDTLPAGTSETAFRGRRGRSATVTAAK